MDPSTGITFAVQGALADGPAWTDLARRVESVGAEALVVADHPGEAASPFVALGAAAAVTTRVGLGTAVVNAGVREPLDIADAAATLDRLCGGRAILGLGAGHTPAEWAATGRAYPSPGERVDRLAEVIPVVRDLLAGETITIDGTHVRLTEARLDPPPDRRIPILVGGSGVRVARLGARHADIVELAGLGRTLPDGHRHEIRWSASDVDRVVTAAHDAGVERTPRLGALVQVVQITDDAEAVAAAVIERVAESALTAPVPSVADLLAAPFTMIGTVDEIVDGLLAARERWGFSRYTVRDGALDDLGQVMAALARR